MELIGGLRNTKHSFDVSWDLVIVPLVQIDRFLHCSERSNKSGNTRGAQ